MNNNAIKNLDYKEIESFLKVERRTRISNAVFIALIAVALLTGMGIAPLIFGNNRHIE